MLTRRTLLCSLAGVAVSHGEKPALSLSQLTCATASLAGSTLEDCLREIRRQRLGGVEIFTDLGRTHSLGAFPAAVVDRLTTAEKKSLRRLTSGFRFVTTHLPFHDLRPVDPDSSLRESSVAAIERGIRDSAWWGASVATIHVARETGYRSVWKELLETYRRFGDLAAKSKLRIGIETGAPETVEEYLALIRAIDHDHVGATVDTGHTRVYRRDANLKESELGTEKGRQRYNDLLMQKVEGLGPKLFHFHVDDVRANDWRVHRTLGRGIVDWQRLLGHLSRVRYQGALAMELEEAPVVAMVQESREFFARQLEMLSRPGGRDRKA